MNLFMVNIKKYIKLILLFFICAGVLIYCISFICRILEYPYFFFSDQHEQIFKILIPQVPILKYYPSRFDLLTGIEFFPIVRAPWSIQYIMSAVYYIQSLKIVIIFIGMLYLMSMISNKTISLCLFPIFIILGDKTVGLIPTLSHTIFPDVSLIFLVILFFIFYLLALQKDYTIYYLFSILCAYTLTYMKEPGFIIFLPILFLKGLLNWKICTRKEKIFYALLFLNCIIFIIAYVLCTYTPGKNYASGISAFTLFDNIKYVLSFSYYLILNMLILLIRLIGYLKTKDKLCFIKIHDIILLSSIGYACSFFILNLNAKYYFSPSYVLSFIAYAGYIYDITFKINSKQFLQELFHYLLLTTATIASMLMLINTSRLDQDTHVPLKIITRPYSLFMEDLEKNNISVKSFLRSIDSYERPHLRNVSYWHYYTTKVFFALYSQPEGSSVTGQKNTYRTGNDIVKTIDEGLIETKKDLINDLDNRSIVQLSPMEIPLVSKWHDEEYVILDAYFTKFIYNKKYESDIHDAYCRFVERVFKDSKGKTRPEFNNLYKQASEKQCNIQGLQ